MGLKSMVKALFTAGQGAVRGYTELRAGADPLVVFDEWFRAAGEAGIYLYESMTLSTATLDGVPSARQVLLKSYGPDGFVFYTNYGSRKVREMDANPRVCLLLHWPTLHRQVRIEGLARRTSKEVSEAYFRTRPRGSQIAAWASPQSDPLDSRDELEARFADRKEEFAGREVPLPPFWGGYRVVPDRIEFWQGRTDRLHDRLLFERTDDGWERSRLAP